MVDILGLIEKFGVTVALLAWFILQKTRSDKAQQSMIDRLINANVELASKIEVLASHIKPQKTRGRR